MTTLAKEQSRTHFSITELGRLACWIRDVLDPLIAREGPDIMKSDDVMAVNDFLSYLQRQPLSLSAIRTTRLHCALFMIAGHGTRWPGRLIDKTDDILEKWSQRFGPLRRLRTPLYERGGRLFGICRQSDVTPKVRAAACLPLTACLLSCSCFCFCSVCPVVCATADVLVSGAVAQVCQTASSSGRKPNSLCTREPSL